MRKVGDLSELHQKYFDLGLRVVAITNEEGAAIEEGLLRTKKPKYWIGSDPTDATESRYRDGNAVSIPKTYLIDAHGRVVGDEIPSEGELEQLLAECFETSLLPELHADLAPARALHARGAYGEAWKAAEARLASTDAALAHDAALLKERIEGHAAFLGKLAEQCVARKMPGRAYGLELLLAKRFAGLDAASAAQAKMRELKADPAVKGELGAWRDLETVLDRDLKPPGAWKGDVLRGSYEKVAKANPGTWAAWFADDRAKELARQ